MSNIAIKVDNLSKKYRLGLVGTGTLSHDLHRFLAKLRGKEDPYALVGDVNDRAIKTDSDYVWALKDINLEVKKGEVLGIIGKNGAGKSTLLKILSKITTPTTGSIKMRGRVSSLLEVGTGFHPELTGRENIYLNGAILGMRKVEIDKKLDEIVDFAGVEKYLDTPVKRYSSGMKVRLGFAVAAHLEPEILIVDEVLAVGDVEFHKKCLGKMQDVSRNDGRTILFVSHNLDSIRTLTENAILMEQGSLAYIGSTEETLKRYLSKSTQDLFISEDCNSILREVRVTPEGLDISINLEEPLKFAISVEVCNELGVKVFTIRDLDDGLPYIKAKGPYTFSAEFSRSFLLPGRYYANISLSELGVARIEYYEDIISFDVTDPSRTDTYTRSGVLYNPSSWTSSKTLG